MAARPTHSSAAIEGQMGGGGGIDPGEFEADDMINFMRKTAEGQGGGVRSGGGLPSKLLSRCRTPVGTYT
jgi:hypothetical protein